MTDLYVYDTATGARLGRVTVTGGQVAADSPYGVMAGQIAGTASGQAAVLAALSGWDNGYLLITADPAARFADTTPGIPRPQEGS